MRLSDRELHADGVFAQWTVFNFFEMTDELEFPFDLVDPRIRCIGVFARGLNLCDDEVWPIGFKRRFHGRLEVIKLIDLKDTRDACSSSEIR